MNFEELSVAQTIKRVAHVSIVATQSEIAAKEALERNGIKIVEQEVHFVHQIVQDTLLKNTKWKDMGVGLLLKRLKVGTATKTKMAGYEYSLRSTKISFQKIFGNEQVEDNSDGQQFELFAVSREERKKIRYIRYIPY